MAKCVSQGDEGTRIGATQDALLGDQSVYGKRLGFKETETV